VTIEFQSLRWKLELAAVLPYITNARPNSEYVIGAALKRIRCEGLRLQVLFTGGLLKLYPWCWALGCCLWSYFLPFIDHRLQNGDKSFDLVFPNPQSFELGRDLTQLRVCKLKGCTINLQMPFVFHAFSRRVV